ncbi:hypothetical protein B0J11DRAFT_602552 [Dendryphion nanum]|uniref:Uncharacterized protein n=1 Tax=Dendryphion nanum TaxID=256645 RepID=A0A9P9E385_9PLEO|nr:hypothetical protein B0J11DRAFT_602552 [Dendryphion nanum]
MSDLSPSTREAHSLASTILHTKLSKLSHLRLRLFPGLKPHEKLSALLHTTAPIIPYPCPPDLDLAFFFAHYNDFARAGFVAGAVSPEHEEQDRDVERAIWYMGLDHQHSFSIDNMNVRVNVVFMVYTLACHRAGVATPWFNSDALGFVEQYLDAFQMYNLPRVGANVDVEAQETFLHTWREGKWDLLPVGSKSVARKGVNMLKTIKGRDGGLWNPLEFMAYSWEMDAQVVEKDGLVMAFRWMEKLEDLRRGVGKKKAGTKEREIAMRGLELGEIEEEEMEMETDDEGDYYKEVDDSDGPDEEYPDNDIDTGIEEDMDIVDGVLDADVVGTDTPLFRALLVEVDVEAVEKGSKRRSIHSRGRKRWLQMDRAITLLQSVRPVLSKKTGKKGRQG